MIPLIDLGDLFTSTTLTRLIFYHLGHSNLISCLTSFSWNKNPVRLKKKEKKVTFGVLRTKVVSKFSVRLQKKKRKKSASFKNILCRGDSINYRKLPLL